MSSDDAQASFSRGGSPLTFLDVTQCDDILADIRQPDGTLPDFGSLPSEPGSRDQATQVVSRPHQGTSSTQTPFPATTSEQGTQALVRPPQSVAYIQTFRPATSTTTSWTQTHRPGYINTGTGVPQVRTTATGSQAGAYFDNEVIPPGVPPLKLPWAYSYAQFDALLTTYPDVHPEDFVTLGILQSQPRWGSYSEGGEEVGVLAHMAGGKRSLHRPHPAS